MKSNNFFNNIFFHSAVKANQKEANLYKEQLSNIPEFLLAINNATTLIQLLNVHKDAYNSNLMRSLAPNPYGYFRTKDIATMSSTEVYLGNIYQLRTNNIDYWENHRDAKFGSDSFGHTKDTLIYDIILTQYKHILLQALKEDKMLAKVNFPLYQKAGY